MMNNLKAEMVRYGVSNVDIQRATGLSERTVRDKLNGTTSFSFPEALAIRNQLFPSMRVEYLFATEDELTEEDSHVQ